MTSPSWAEVHARRWQRPVEVIPNGHDMEALAPVAAPDGYVVSYLGTYYPATQDLSAAIGGDRPDRGRRRAEVDRLRFIGPLHPALRSQIDDLGLGAIVQETGFVGHDRAIELLRELVGAAARRAGRCPRHPSRSGRGEDPGVPRDAGCRSSTSAIPTAMPRGCVGSHPGCHVVATGDVEGVVRALAACRDGRRHERDTASLSRRLLAGRLAHVLDAAAGDGATSG